MLMPYVHGRAQPVGELMTRDAFQLRLHGGLLVLHTGRVCADPPIKHHQRILGLLKGQSSDTVDYPESSPVATWGSNFARAAE